MRKENRMDDKAKAPDPDDLTRETPPEPPEITRREPKDPREDEGYKAPRDNPDSSAPHLPPHE